jgi:hypothetical protein
VCWIYRQADIQLPRSARDQIQFGSKVEKREDIKPGDIVVFKGTRGRTGWHSGIYTGNGRFVHSPGTGKSVTESRLDEDYYARRFAGARRIPGDGSAREMYAHYEARQKAEYLAARESKQSRRHPPAANSKTRGKETALADKSGKKTAAKAAKAGKNSKRTVAEIASTHVKAVPDAGAGKKGASKQAKPSGKQPAAASGGKPQAKKQAKAAAAQTDKRGTVGTSASSYSKSRSKTY